jgi:DNA-binding HxlR family transcriptional regulator
MSTPADKSSLPAAPLGAVHVCRNSTPSGIARKISNPHGAGQKQPIPAAEESAIQFAIALIQGKWKIAILRRLQHGPVRLGELRRLLPQASKKVLTQHLRRMEKDGLIIRIDIGGKVPRVEYSLATPLGCAVLNLLQAMAKWGDQNLPSSAKSQGPVRPRKTELGVEILNAQQDAETAHRVAATGTFGADLCAAAD